jgi:hypothetical protein
VLGLDLLARAFARVPPRQADELVAGLQALVRAAARLDDDADPHEPDQNPHPQGPDETQMLNQNSQASEGDDDDDNYPGV